MSHHSWDIEQKRGTYLELSWEIADFKSNRITDYSGHSCIFLVFSIAIIWALFPVSGVPFFQVNPSLTCWVVKGSFTQETPGSFSL